MNEMGFSNDWVSVVEIKKNELARKIIQIKNKMK